MMIFAVVIIFLGLLFHTTNFIDATGCESNDEPNKREEKKKRCESEEQLCKQCKNIGNKKKTTTKNTWKIIRREDARA